MTLQKEINKDGNLELKSNGTTLLTVINPDEEWTKDADKAPKTEEPTPAPKAPAKKSAQQTASDNGEYINKVYTYATQRIIEQLEKGTIPWERGYSTSLPRNALTGHIYRGINIWLLEFAQQAHGYKSNLWLSYDQAQQIKGGHIRAGEKSPMQVFFYRLIDKRTEAEKQEMKTLSWSSDRYKELSKKVYRVFRYTNVFNIEQVEGWTEERKQKHAPEERPIDHDPVQSAEDLLNNWADAPTIQHGGNSAWYSPAKDLISMPGPERHEDINRYYKTRFHESIHATGHESRLNRYATRDFGSITERSIEELTAELGASMLCTLTGIYTEEVHQNASAYIASWIEVLQNDHKFIVQASSKAHSAVDYITGADWTKNLKDEE